MILIKAMHYAIHYTIQKLEKKEIKQFQHFG